MSAAEHLGMQWGPHNDDPALGEIMAGRTITRESIPVDRVLGGVKISRTKARRYAALPTPLPPVVGREHEGQFIVYDGNHRVEAARLRGQAHIDAYIGR